MIYLPTTILAMPEGEDRDYIEKLYIDFHRLMYATARKLTREPAAVEDIVSESTLKLIGHIDTLRGLSRQQVAAYVTRTVWNTALKHARAARREEIVEPCSWQFPADLTADVERQILAQEELALVLAQIYQLPPQEQRAMRLKYGGDMTDAEIAAALGVSETTVRGYLSRARQRLKAALYGEEAEGTDE